MTWPAPPEDIGHVIAAQIAELASARRPFAICIEGNEKEEKAALDSRLACLYRERYEIYMNTIFWHPV